MILTKLFSIFVTLSLCDSKFAPNWQSLDSRPIPLWYDEAKVGVFMHWGVYSVPGMVSEWFWNNWHNGQSDIVKFMKQYYPADFKYPDFAKNFRARFFNASHFATIVKNSGARYYVPTSKHHEGYTMWRSNYSWNWNSYDVGSGRNLLEELKNAFKIVAPDVKFGLYYSLFEWFHPLYLRDQKTKFQTQQYINAVSWPQLIELIETFQPEYIFSDGDWDAPAEYWKSQEFLAWLYNSSPVKDSVVVNDRWGHNVMCHHGDTFTCQDRYNPGKLQKHKWENAMTIDKHSWGIRHNISLSDVIPINELILELASTISCGGNLLINVGPTQDGTIIPIFEERLCQLGDWLKINGEGVYATKPWIYQKDSLTTSVWYTSKLRTDVSLDPRRSYNEQNQTNTIVYAIVTKWPEADKLLLNDPLRTPETKMAMLGCETCVCKKDSDVNGGPKLEIDLSCSSISKLPSLDAWVLKFENLASDNHNPFQESAETVYGTEEQELLTIT